MKPRKHSIDPKTGELRIDPTGMTEAEKVLASIFDPTLTKDMDPVTPLDDPESVEEILTEHLEFVHDLGFPVPLNIIPEPFRTQIEDARTQVELDDASDALDSHYKLAAYNPPLIFVISPSAEGHHSPWITLTRAV